MNLSARARRLLVESPGSVGGRARSRRWSLVCELFPDLERLNVIDLGGTVEAWRRAPVRPKQVTVLNLSEPGVSEEPWITPVLGDACDPEPALEGIGTSFDLVFSNSLIEHVGGHANRVRVADAVRRLAPRHWVQTPYRYFPIEPHWLFPGMQWLPDAARVRVATSWPLSHSGGQTPADARAAVLWTDLLSVTALRECFPDSTIIHERVAGVTKSLVAVQN